MSPQDRTWSLADFELGPAIAKGCTAVVYSARLRSKENLGQAVTFPLAIKMMFNYHAESNAFTILRAMHRETVPARSMTVPGEVGDLVQMLDTDKVQLKAHPNIVEMVAVFADQVPDLPGAEALYPTALPSRYCYQLARYSPVHSRYLSLVHSRYLSPQSYILPPGCTPPAWGGT